MMPKKIVQEEVEFSGTIQEGQKVIKFKCLGETVTFNNKGKDTLLDRAREIE